MLIKSTVDEKKAEREQIQRELALFTAKGGIIARVKAGTSTFDKSAYINNWGFLGGRSTPSFSQEIE
jgi:hypothetical protein